MSPVFVSHCAPLRSARKFMEVAMLKERLFYGARPTARAAASTEARRTMFCRA